MKKTEEAAVDTVLEELMELENLVGPMLRRICEIKGWCKEQGSFSTEKFMCIVQPRKQRRMVSMKDAAKVLGGFGVLEELDLIHEISFLVVAVAKKYENKPVG